MRAGVGWRVEGRPLDLRGITTIISEAFRGDPMSLEDKGKGNTGMEKGHRRCWSVTLRVRIVGGRVTTVRSVLFSQVAQC